MKPVIALVGRPNVGKSTLFNRLTRSRDALVADLPGLTRDRHYGEGRVGERPFLVIDTGGFEPVAKEGILHEMAKQTKQAVAEADVVVFIVDGRQGLTPHDKTITDFLRKAGRKVMLVVNKSEGMKYTSVTADFYELGLGDPYVISAAHGDGVADLVSEALDLASQDKPDDVDDDDKVRGIKIAIVGRPNVGKSTMVNTLLGEERVIAFDMPGTTRDSIEIPFERDGRHYSLIDTAGIRRKGKVFEAIEKFSVVKTLQAIENANVVLLLIDAEQGVTDQDAHIAGFVLDSGRAVVLAVNKWDAVDEYQRQLVQRSIETRLAFLKFANLHFISAKKRQGLGPLWTSIAQAHKAATCKMTTPVLTRILLESVQFQTPKKTGMFRPKLRYAHQGGMNPPVIVIHGNSLEHVTEAYKRFLEGRFRKAFDLVGTPLRIEMKTSHNPYADKDSA